MGGIKGFHRRVARSLEKGEPLHRSAGQSAKSRSSKKLMAKTQWFRKGEESSQKDEPMTGGKRVAGGNGAERCSQGKSSQDDLRTTSVLFVEFSRGGSLQKRMKECLDQISPMLGFKVRVTEKGGHPSAHYCPKKISGV